MDSNDEGKRTEGEEDMKGGGLSTGKNVLGLFSRLT